LAGLALIAPPGTRASYSQAGFNLAGRIVEKVTGLRYEKAVASLVFEPAGLAGSFFDRDDIMTRRFAVGHNRGEDGTLAVGRLWRRSRGDNPGGGIASSAADMLRWARFHLGSGVPGVLPAEVLRRMREPTTALRGSSLGDAIGIGWFLRDVDGVRAAGHGGSANGQFADLLLVPERGFAVAVLCNEGPDGIPFNQAVIRWALREYLGLADRDPEPLPFDEARAREVAGRYENEVMTFTGSGRACGWRSGSSRRSGRRRTRNRRRIPRRSTSACFPGTSTSSPTASTRASAASSPATRAARSPASTWPGGSRTGSSGAGGREGQGGQDSWTQAPVTRRRASWAGVIGSPQRAQGWLAERAALASGPSGGSPAGPRPIGPESVTGRPTPPGQK
jgi:CubicO group peptidase (beta-lactamase class C family)